jgi:glycosyltransferase involved in cell wall biosynthesis/GT2 family glycosyltransferase
VVPFAGSPEQAEALVEALQALELADGDELIVVDNSPRAVLGSVAGDASPRVIEAAEEQSSYYARNVGAEAAAADWLLFIDADCRPSPTLLDEYFSEPVDGEVGALAGRIAPAGQSGLLPRWAASRRLIDQELLGSGPGPQGAATANLLVRRAAWESVGGFHEGVRSGADIEFCWRLQDGGWKLAGRPGATVTHLHRESLRQVARQMARYGAGNAWQERRRTGSVPRLPLVPGVAVALAGAAAYALTLRFERAAMKLVDCVALAASAWGWWCGNAAARTPQAAAAGTGAPAGQGRSLVVSSDYFPALSETFVRADVDSLRAAGWRLRVEAIARPERPRLGGTRGLAVNYLEDEGRIQRLRDTAWLVSRHPLGCVLDLRRRRRFAPDERLPLRALAPFARRLASGHERHVHVHFALMAAVNAIRAGAIAGVPVSVAAHAHEIYARPRNLREKLNSVSFAVADCDYTVTHLRELAGSSAAARIHKIVLGVDLERWRRETPHADGGGVIAVGRLVEKKGFGKLVAAAAILAESAERPPRVRIVGDGPLRDELKTQIRRAGVEQLVELVGSLEPAEVRELVERSELLCMPCVVAANGDRDSMPVVVKEALALELPVVASDEVGLPEIVEPGWGRLVPPGDPAALAEAIGQLLALPLAERVRMGRRGRAAVEERANLATESAKLARLLESEG